MKCASYLIGDPKQPSVSMGASFSLLLAENYFILLHRAMKFASLRCFEKYYTHFGSFL